MYPSVECVWLSFWGFIGCYTQILLGSLACYHHELSPLTTQTLQNKTWASWADPCRRPRWHEWRCPGWEDWSWDPLSTLCGGRASRLQEGGPNRSSWNRLLSRRLWVESCSGKTLLSGHAVDIFTWSSSVPESIHVVMLCMYSKSSIVCVHVGHVPSRVSVSSKWRSVGTSP